MYVSIQYTCRICFCSVEYNLCICYSLNALIMGRYFYIILSEILSLFTKTISKCLKYYVMGNDDSVKVFDVNYSGNRQLNSKLCGK